jgi:hypothetical protein
VASASATWTPLPGTVASLPWWAAEPRLSVPLNAGGSPPLSESLTGAVAVELTPASASGLANREIRRLAFRSLPFRSRQGGTNQTAVNRTVVLDALSGGGQGVGALGFPRWMEPFYRRGLDVRGIIG